MADALTYQNYVTEIARLYVEASGKGNPPLPPLTRPAEIGNDPLKILIVSPHPDDECLMGSYALRLKEECGAQVFVLPLTYGSNQERRAERKQELMAAVKVLGFELVERGKVKDEYAPYILNDLLAVMKKLQPQLIFSPHEEDAHPVHQKAFQQTRDALQILQKPEMNQNPDHQQKRLWVQTEFWRDLKTPNLLVPLSNAHVVKIGQALQCHRGEVERNPYHWRLPAWLQDQVRKGSERVGGAGAEAVEAVFGQIYFQSLV
jgi:LmbE family N-acetylglucosaminyl deacetylase